jgi:hypothetical protein
MPVPLKSKKRPSGNQKTIGEQKVLKQWQVLIEAIRRRRAIVVLFRREEDKNQKNDDGWYTEPQ